MASVRRAGRSGTCAVSSYISSVKARFVSPSSLRVLAALTALFVGLPWALSAPTSTVDHLCVEGEGKGVCPIGHVRMCDKSGGLVTCACPPGASASAPTSSCTVTSEKYPPACVVPDATIAATLGATLELGTLEVPRLPQTAFVGADLTVSNLDGKLPTATADELVKLAMAHEALEGEAAYGATTAQKSKVAGLLAKRDASVTRVIDVRKALAARFPADSRIGEQRVALARALLRRAAYAGVATSVVVDRSEARAQLTKTRETAKASVAARDAGFALAEQAARDKDWKTVALLELDVRAIASGKKDVDDHAYLAAASARLAEARLALGDLSAARDALVDAIDAGNVCSPRAECVSAAASSRDVLDRVFAALGLPARAMAKILAGGTMPKQERIRPLLRLAELYAKSPGTTCAAAADEAKAWSIALK